MLPENLNIEYNTKLLLVKALNKYNTFTKAASALQITERTLYTYMKAYKVEKKKGQYKIPGLNDTV